MRAGSAAAAVLVGMAAVAGVDAGAVAAAPAKISTLSLRLGDQLRVTGSSISCIVQKSGATVNFACVLGSLSRPNAHSYAVGISDKGADLAAVSASGGSAKIVTAVQEPAISAAAFPSPARKAEAFAVAPTTAILVGGTHILLRCADDQRDDQRDLRPVVAGRPPPVPRRRLQRVRERVGSRCWARSSPSTASGRSPSERSSSAADAALPAVASARVTAGIGFDRPPEPAEDAPPAAAAPADEPLRGHRVGKLSSFVREDERGQRHGPRPRGPRPPPRERM